MAVKSYTVANSSTTTEEEDRAESIKESLSGTDMDDNGYSDYNLNRTYENTDAIVNNQKDIFNAVRRAHGLYQRSDIDLFNRRYRFGLFNPYEALSTTREFLFFTKPDLNIFSRDDDTGALDSPLTLNEDLANIPYWQELFKRYRPVLRNLQLSYSKTNPFNHFLANMCISNLSVPSLSAEVIDTPSNMYGVNFSYRGSSEASNDSFEFDLEFKDTRYLVTYQYFKAYEEYETLKHHGQVSPWPGYLSDKILHDQFAIYKFLVDEDMETIVYWAKFYGVFPTSLPRDVFSSSTFDSGLSYSISFKCAFFDDMDPLILNDFNVISSEYVDSLKYRIDVFNEKIDRMDNRPAMGAYIVSEYNSNAPGNKVYKLKWKGNDRY